VIQEAAFLQRGEQAVDRRIGELRAPRNLAQADPVRARDNLENQDRTVE
jgi:hypothetical protein